MIYQTAVARLDFLRFLHSFPLFAFGLIVCFRMNEFCTFFFLRLLQTVLNEKLLCSVVWIIGCLSLKICQNLPFFLLKILHLSGDGFGHILSFSQTPWIFSLEFSLDFFIRIFKLFVVGLLF
jgi:hypothetical protein